MNKRLLALSLGAASALVLAAAAGAQGTSARPWLDRSLSADARAQLAVSADDARREASARLRLFCESDWQEQTSRPPEARYGSAGYVPGIPRLGIPPQWETDAGVGVATQGGAPQKRERTALPSGIATAATWNPAIAVQGRANDRLRSARVRAST